MHSVQLEDQNDTCLLKDSTVKLLKIKLFIAFLLAEGLFGCGPTGTNSINTHTHMSSV